MTTRVAPRQQDRPVLASAVVTAVEPFGSYRRIDLVAPDIARRFSAGQFVSVVVGDGLDMPLRRHFSILDADSESGRVSFLVAVFRKGTEWLTRRRPGDQLDVLGPLGEPFPAPPAGAVCLAIAGGHGGTALYRLIRDGVEHGARMHLLAGAASVDRLFLPAEIHRDAESVAVSTDDGSMGIRGSVRRLVDDALAVLRPDIAYACGPMPMLQAVNDQLAEHRIPVYAATEAAMACAIGVCMTCVLPIVGDDGVTRMTPSCLAGPVLRGDRVRWADIGTVPTDCWGA